MPYTRKQIDRINNVDGEPFLAGDFSLSMRTSESYIRRRLFALEDRAINDAFALWQAAYRDIRRAAQDAGERLPGGALSVTPESLDWKRRVLEYAGLRIRRLSRATSGTVLQSAVTAYALGYYGRAYVLDMATTDAAEIKIPRLVNRDVTRRVLQPRLQEAAPIEPDGFMVDLFGADWQDTYTDIGDELVISIRRAIDTGLASGKSMTDVLAAIAAVMGVDDTQKGAFSKLNRATRDYVLGAGSSGGVDMLNVNAVWVLGMMWVATANDNRTCSVCRGLHGTVWALGDSSMLIAPFDSHSMCRCGMLPVILPDVSSPDNEPPRDTWDEWLDELNELWWLKQELGRAQLDSALIGELA